jgi:hypothetical protein
MFAYQFLPVPRYQMSILELVQTRGFFQAKENRLWHSGIKSKNAVVSAAFALHVNNK